MDVKMWILMGMDCASLDNDDPGWILCDDLQNPDAAIFCDTLLESDFDIQLSDNNNMIIDPPGQFEGSTEGEMIMDLAAGLYDIEEIRISNTTSTPIDQFMELGLLENICTNANFCCCWSISRSK